MYLSFGIALPTILFLFLLGATAQQAQPICGLGTFNGRPSATRRTTYCELKPKSVYYCNSDTTVGTYTLLLHLLLPFLYGLFPLPYTFFSYPRFLFSTHFNAQLSIYTRAQSDTAFKSINNRKSLYALRIPTRHYSSPAPEIHFISIVLRVV